MIELENLIKPMGEKYAVLHPGAADIHRQWSPEKFAQIEEILAESGMKVYVTGTLSECAIAEKVVDNMKFQARNICGKLSMNAFVALLSRANVVVSNDTGPLHLARALGAPTVGIYWSQNVLTAGVVTASKNRICVSWNSFCPACGIDCTKEDVHHPSGICSHAFSFVDDITVEEVAEKTLELIQPQSRVLKAAL